MHGARCLKGQRTAVNLLVHDQVVSM
jgi:hypothetical protein